jgi:hypothetical protein
MPVIRSKPQFENRDDGGGTKQPDDYVVQRLRKIETDAAERGHGPRRESDPRLLIAFVCEATVNAITFTESAKRIGFPDASVTWSGSRAAR